MERKDYKNAVISVLQAQGKALHIDEITKLCQPYFPSIPYEKLRSTLNRVLAEDVKKKTKSTFSKVPNKQGGKQRGIYKLKRTPNKPINNIASTIETSLQLPHNIKTDYLGKAGEYGVISELMFRGFNAGNMAIDEGVDVVAIKEKEQFNIQVKTRTVKNGRINVQLEYKYFKKNQFLNTFYIIVIRYLPPKEMRERSDYIIFHSRDIENYFSDELEKEKPINFNIKVTKEGLFLKNMDISKHLNEFDAIK